MAIKVVTGFLSEVEGSGYVDLTSSGFGTVQAAIVISSATNASSNPINVVQKSIGFWDGINGSQCSLGAFAKAGGTPTRTRRVRSTTYGVSMQADNASPTVFNCQEVISSITDGIRITHTSGTTGAERYVTAFLINGISDAHIGAINLGTSTSPQDITTVPFKSTLVLFANAGVGDEVGAEQAHLSFGIAHNSSDDTVSQGMVLWSSLDNAATSEINNYTSSSKIAAQIISDDLYYTVNVSDFDSSGFSVTTSASADSDLLDFMALELPSADDAWVGLIQAATSTGNSSVTGVGFEPLGLGLVSADSVSLDTIEDVGGFSFALIDPSGIKCYSIAQTDASGTTAATSEYSTTFKLKFDDTSTDAIASLVSLDADGFTLNYSNAASSASRILAFAIGESAVAGIAIGTVTESDSALPITAQKRAALGTVTESDSALPITAQKRAALGTATETDSALPITAQKRAALGTATETDSALPITIGNTGVLGTVVEFDAAQPITFAKRSTLGTATETNAAQPISAAKVSALGVASESDLAQAIQAIKRALLGTAEETDAALTIVVVNPGDLLGTATETDSALAILVQKISALGMATETDLARPLGSGGTHVFIEGNNNAWMVGARGRVWRLPGRSRLN